MGGICAKRAAVDKSPSDIAANPNESRSHHDNPMEAPIEETVDSGGFYDHSFAFSDPGVPKPKKQQISRVLSERSRSRATHKVSEVSSLLGRAGTVGFGKAVDVLDTLGSSMSGLNVNSGFIAGTTDKRNRISILAFEVANTIVKGANLMQSLSKESIKHLKKVVIPSEGVQHLISKDTDELLMIAANDKREELKIFSGEVVRFGNHCKDPQWHNLDRYFTRLESEVTPQNKLKEEAAGVMRRLMVLVQHTAELYHELHALDRFEQDYRRKVQEEENSNAVQRGDNFQILRQELKSQRKHVQSLKKKSLWSKVLEEVVEKLVDIVHFLYLEIQNALGTADGDQHVRKSIDSQQRLGSAGLALHYANIFSQIDTLVSRSNSVPSNTRDSLYQGLPPKIKCALRSKLQLFQAKEELTVLQIKAEMDKTLQWLVPVANNTTKAHQGFGWVGEWANTGSVLNKKAGEQPDLCKLETLYHADKEKTDAYVLDLVVLLHHLISQSRPTNGWVRSPVKSPIRSPTMKTVTTNKTSTPLSTLSKEDQDMLRDVSKWKHTPGVSKSQEFFTGKSRMSRICKLSKSSSHSPTTTETMAKELPLTRRRPVVGHLVDFDIDRIKALDVIDRVDTLRNL